MKEIPRIAVFCPKIGHGNPATAEAISSSYGEESRVSIFNGPGVLVLSRVHQVMTRLKGLSDLYSEGSEKVRSGLGIIGIGLLQLPDFLRNSGLILHPFSPLSEVGIFTQEHVLGVLPSEVLTQWFPRGVFLYIPDVYPKASAVAILKKLEGVVTPLVWNTAAYEELRKEGLNPQLVESVLPFGLIGKREIGELNPSKIVVKSSGSGIPHSVLQAILQSRKRGTEMEVWLPKKIMEVTDSGTEERQPSDDEYLSSFYQSLLDAETIICGPSEMVQVVAALVAAGWKGKVILLPTRGRHEVRNREWLVAEARNTGLMVEEVDFDGIKVTKIDFEKATPACFKGKIGERSVREVIGELVRQRETTPIAVSTEAFDGYHFVPGYVKKELVVASADEIGDDVDWSNISGVHYRPKKKEGFFKGLEDVIEKVAGKTKYVTIHLEDLWGLSPEKDFQKKLEKLNESAQKAGVYLLLENVTPRVDNPNLAREFWSLLDFEKNHGDLLNELPNIGYCLDIAHLGLAEPKVLEVWRKVVNSEALSEDKQEIWRLTQQVLNRTKTIHWSRARERKKPVDQGVIFRTAHYLTQRFPYGLLGLKPERIHNIYSRVENIRNAHYSLISDPDMLSMILKMLEELGWQGEIIIESPALLQLVRERRRPFKDEINALGEWIPRARKNILERIFKENGIFGEDLEDVLNFSFSEAVASLSPEFFGVLRRVFPLLIEVYPLDLKRKVNEGLYLRHILRTMVLADELYRQLRSKGVNLNYEVLMMAVALHDAIEISRENGREVSVEYLQQRLREIGFDEDDARNISHMSEFLVPKETSSENYFEQKQKDFDRIWDGEGLSEEERLWWEANKDYLKVIKAADVLANLEETVDDLEKGRKDGRMKRFLVERYQVFEYRIGKINQWLESNLLEERRKKNQEVINYLLNKMPRLRKFRELISSRLFNIEIKYVVGEDELVIAPGDFYVHRIMASNISGRYSGGVIQVKVVNEAPVIFFVRGASSIEADNNGENFFKWLSMVQEGEIKILEVNPNNPVAGLTYE
jgi:hypothetical protein